MSTLELETRADLERLTDDELADLALYRTCSGSLRCEDCSHELDDDDTWCEPCAAEDRAVDREVSLHRETPGGLL